MTLSMKGSFIQVIRPLSEQVLKPFLKNWSYWGKAEADFMKITQDIDIRHRHTIRGFYIFVDTSRGSFIYKFTRKEDAEGFFIWEQVEEKQIKEAKDDPRTIEV